MSKRTQLLHKLKHVYSHNTKLVLDVENKDIELIVGALEKQIRKKVERYSCNTIGEMTFNYCPNCGQKINWSEED